MSEFVRITWELGGETTTAWSENVTVRREVIKFTSLKTGHTRHVSHATPYTITQGVDLPPRVQEAMNDA